MHREARRAQRSIFRSRAHPLGLGRSPRQGRGDYAVALLVGGKGGRAGVRRRSRVPPICPPAAPPGGRIPRDPSGRKCQSHPPTALGHFPCARHGNRTPGPTCPGEKKPLSMEGACLTMSAGVLSLTAPRWKQPRVHQLETLTCDNTGEAHGNYGQEKAQHKRAHTM